jgi:hypothetical protein
MTIGEFWDKYIIGSFSDLVQWFGDGAHKILNLNLSDLTIGQFIFTLAIIGFSVRGYIFIYEDLQARHRRDIELSRDRSEIIIEEILFWLSNIIWPFGMILALYLLLLLGDHFR